MALIYRLYIVIVLHQRVALNDLRSVILQKNQVNAEIRITRLPDSAKPFAKAKLYKRAVLGPLSFEIGNVVELEDEDDASELPLLGLVQCIFEGEEASEFDIQVLCQGA